MIQRRFGSYKTLGGWVPTTHFIQKILGSGRIRRSGSISRTSKPCPGQSENQVLWCQRRVRFFDADFLTAKLENWVVNLRRAGGFTCIPADQFFFIFPPPLLIPHHFVQNPSGTFSGRREGRLGTKFNQWHPCMVGPFDFIIFVSCVFAEFFVLNATAVGWAGLNLTKQQDASCIPGANTARFHRTTWFFPVCCLNEKSSGYCFQFMSVKHFFLEN